MNPTEKANDLVNQYRMILMDEDTECGNEILCTSIAVKMAIVTCNEMIEHTSNDYDYKGYVFWTDVIKALGEI